jgi:hypothetical protein
MKRENFVRLGAGAFAHAFAATVVVAGCSRSPVPTVEPRGADVGAAPDAESEPPARNKITCEGGAKPVLTKERDGHLVAVTCPNGARQAVLCQGPVRRARLFDDGRFYVECSEDHDRR